MTTNPAGKTKERDSTLQRPGLKKRVSSAPRLQRLAPLTTRTMARPTQRAAHSRSSSKASLSERETADEDVATETFLQYCAYCEKQTEVSDATTLYCSEICRQRDLQSPYTYELFSQDAPHPTPNVRRSVPYPEFRDIVPQLSPTIRPQPTPRAHSSESSSSTTTTAPSQHQPQSSTMLSRPATEPSAPLSHHHHHHHHHHHTHDSRSYVSTTPALSSAATSLSTNASVHPYSPSAYPSRPLHSRFGSAISAKSVDLVTPVTAAPHQTTATGSPYASKARRDSDRTITPGDSDEATSLSYEKRRNVRILGPPTEVGSLKQLFSPLANE